MNKNLIFYFMNGKEYIAYNTIYNTSFHDVVFYKENGLPIDNFENNIGTFYINILNEQYNIISMERKIGDFLENSKPNIKENYSLLIKDWKKEYGFINKELIDFIFDNIEKYIEKCLFQTSKINNNELIEYLISILGEIVGALNEHIRFIDNYFKIKEKYKATTKIFQHLKSKLENPLNVIYFTCEKNGKLISYSNTGNIIACKMYEIELFQNNGQIRFDSMLDMYLNYFIENNIRIKKCKNCGKYFIPNNKQMYCDNPSPQNEKYTCRQLSCDVRKSDDVKYKIYRRNYIVQTNKKNNNLHIPNIQEKFFVWNENARKKLTECRNNEITLEEFKQWFKQNKNWLNEGDKK